MAKDSVGGGGPRGRPEGRPAGHPGGHPGAGEGKPVFEEVDFSESPYVIYWETTRACDLACRHCRAEAVDWRDPRELSTLEAMRLMNNVRRFGRRIMVLTGGDPMQRPDVFELVEHGTRIGLRIAMTPAGTPRTTPEALLRLRDAGLARLAVSLDGSCPEIHDDFRRVPGSFRWSLDILKAAREIGLTTQVNTTITRYNLDDFDRMAELMHDLGIVMWSVFFLIPTGRAQLEDVPSAEEFEEVFHKLYDLSRTAPFDVKSTAGPHFRRVVIQRQVEERRRGERTEAPGPLTDGAGFSLKDGIGRAKGANDGDGVMFVSHVGDIYPSGFLPIPVGNVRTHDLVEVYRNHPVFRRLRDRSLLKGKCGVCEYRAVCGGSRARAYAVTGDYLAEEPFCAHVPSRGRKEKAVAAAG